MSLLYLLSVLALLSLTSGLTTRWIGFTGDVHWANPNNWYCADIHRNCTPQIGDDVVIEHNPSCSQCIRDIVIGPTQAAQCGNLTIIATADNPISLTIQTSLTIANKVSISMNTKVLVIGYIDLRGNNFTSDGGVELNGGRLSGSIFYLNTLNISANAVVSQAQVKNIWFTPASPDLSCSLGGTINVTGTISAYTPVILSGTIRTGRLVYSSQSAIYRLSIQGDLTAGYVKVTGGIVQTFTGTSKFDVLELDNIGYSVVSNAQFGNVTGNGTITLSSSTAHVQATVYDYDINFYLTYGTLVLYGTHCGHVSMNQYQGYPSVTFGSDNFLIHNATFVGGTVLGTSGYVNYLLVSNVNVQSVKLYLLREMNIPATGFYSYLNLGSGTFIISPKAVVRCSSSFYIQGYGTVINEGEVFVNAAAGFVCAAGVVATGNGTWTSSATGYISFSSPSTIGGLVNISTGFLAANGNYGNYTFNDIIGDGSVTAGGEGFYVRNITAKTFTDQATLNLTLSNFQITNYQVYNSYGYKFLKNGTIASFSSQSGYFVMNFEKVSITTMSLYSQNTINIMAPTLIQNLNWAGGLINQTDISGIFRVANATVMMGTQQKWIGPNTILQTNILDCTRCSSPDCALSLSDWNHIQAAQSFNCLIGSSKKTTTLEK